MAHVSVELSSVEPSLQSMIGPKRGFSIQYWHNSNSNQRLLCSESQKKADTKS